MAQIFLSTAEVTIHTILNCIVNTKSVTAKSIVYDSLGGRKAYLPGLYTVYCQCLSVVQPYVVFGMTS